MQRIKELEGLEGDVLIDCQNVGVCYRKPFKLGKKHARADREFWPFRDLSIQIRRGETLGVVGRNGAGKSTLLRLIAGVIDPDAGFLIRRPNLRVQLLSVNLGFERILTGRENALMAGMFLGLSRAQVKNRIEAIKEFSELGDFFEEPVYAYSSGMVARLGFSIAIEADPDVLLMDELLSVGDASFREKSGVWIRQARDRGITIAIVNHNKAMIDKFCDRKIEL